MTGPISILSADPSLEIDRILSNKTLLFKLLNLVRSLNNYTGNLQIQGNGPISVTTVPSPSPEAVLDAIITILFNATAAVKSTDHSITVTNSGGMADLSVANPLVRNQAITGDLDVSGTITADTASVDNLFVASSVSLPPYGSPGTFTCPSSQTIGPDGRVLSTTSGICGGGGGGNVNPPNNLGVYFPAVIGVIPSASSPAFATLVQFAGVTSNGFSGIGTSTITVDKAANYLVSFQVQFVTNSPTTLSNPDTLAAALIRSTTAPTTYNKFCSVAPSTASETLACSVSFTAQMEFAAGETVRLRYSNFITSATATSYQVYGTLQMMEIIAQGSGIQNVVSPDNTILVGGNTSYATAVVNPNLSLSSLTTSGNASVGSNLAVTNGITSGGTASLGSSLVVLQSNDTTHHTYLEVRSSPCSSPFNCSYVSIISRTDNTNDSNSAPIGYWASGPRGFHNFYSNGYQVFAIAPTPTSVAGNYIQVQGQNTSAQIYAQGVVGNESVRLELFSQQLTDIRFESVIYPTGTPVPGFYVTFVSGCVNYWKTTSAATGGITYMTVVGSDSSPSGAINSQNQGSIFIMNGFNINVQFFGVASSVTHLQATPAVSGGGYKLRSNSFSDANVPFTLASKGIGSNIIVAPGDVTSLVVTSVTSGVNFMQISSAISGSAPTIYALGADTDIDVSLTPKNAGVLRLQYSSSAATTPGSFIASRYMRIKDLSGTVYYVPLATAAWMDAPVTRSELEEHMDTCNYHKDELYVLIQMLSTKINALEKALAGHGWVLK